MNKLIVMRCMILAFCMSTVSIFDTSAEQQNYVSILQTDDIQVDPISYISWGFVDDDRLELYNIPLNTDGYIDYSIGSVGEVDVLLVSEDNPNKYYGFKHSTTTFDIIVEGMPASYTVDNDYNSGTDFKVEKCGDKIFFYKDGVLIYTFCADYKLDVMFHRTLVEEASGAQIDLVFESESMGCTSNILLDSGGLSLRGDSGTQVEELLNARYVSNKYVIINLFTQDGEPVKQYRKRTNKDGFITRVLNIKKLAIKENYIITIKEETKVR